MTRAGASIGRVTFFPAQRAGIQTYLVIFGASRRAVEAVDHAIIGLKSQRSGAAQGQFRAP